MNDDSFPACPTFSRNLVKEYRGRQDFRPILFEWYKYVVRLCNTAASIMPESPALRQIPHVYYAVPVGLLNRRPLREVSCVLTHDQPFEGLEVEMSWHKIGLTNDEVVAGEFDRIQGVFEALFIAARAPEGAAMFGRGDATGEYELYWSPVAATLVGSLIRARGGVACAAPPKEGTALVVGHADASAALLR